MKKKADGEPKKVVKKGKPPHFLLFNGQVTGAQILAALKKPR
jgi:hypothetical protein